MRKIIRAVYLILIVLFLYLPIGTLMVLSFNEGKSMASWQGFSLKWYQEMFQNSEIMEALGNTLTIALWASVISTIVGLLACIALNAMNEKRKMLFLGLNNIPLLNADIVTGISIMMSFILFGISLNYASVLFAHITFCIPYVILSILPKFNQLENNTYEAALDLGATPTYAFFKVVLPDLMPGIVSGFLLSFTMSVDDFVITHFTRGAGINTLSTLIYSQLKVGVRPTLYALSTCIFILVLIILVISNVSTKPIKVTKVARQGSGKEEEYTYKTGMEPRTVMAIVLVLCLIMLASIQFTPSTPGEIGKNGVIYVYNFGDYIDMGLIEDFEEETNYTVVMDYFDTNEEMYPVVKNSTASYDVICASDYMIDKLISEGILTEIDYTLIPNITNLTDNVVELSNGYDPGMQYSVPHTWGTYGIIFNRDMVDNDDFYTEEGELKDVSWSILWDEKYEGSVIMPNSIREADMAAAKLLGYSLNTTDEDEISEITNKLIEQKPLVYSYANDNARDLMIGDSAALALISSGDVLYAIDENESLDYVLPVEGSEVWTDCWAVPKACENYNGAMAWINFMLKAESAEANFEYLTYAIPNKALMSANYECEDLDIGKGELRFNPIVNPKDEILKRCETLKNLGAECDDIYSKYWKKFKAK